MTRPLLALTALGLACFACEASGGPGAREPIPGPQGEQPGKDRPGVTVEPTGSSIASSCSTALTGPFNEELPVPSQVVVVGDDLSARVSWDGGPTKVEASTPTEKKVEGYRVCYGPSETELNQGMLFTNREGTILDVQNDEQRVLVVQTVDMLGNVSRPSEVVPFKASGDRVDKLAGNMTGFFDDFNLAEGPLDELKWNVAFSTCADPSVAFTYINAHHQAVSVLGNDSELPGSVPGCDRGQNIARPRAVFDFQDRLGKIVFDMDGAMGNRSTWYLDVFPYEGPESVLDITAHVTFDPGHGHPGRFLRFAQSDNVFRIHRHLPDGNAAELTETDTTWDFQGLKTMPGEVFRHFELQVSKNYAAILIDGQVILENDGLNLDFDKGYVQWAQFGYNPVKMGYPWHTFHFDNFGFDGKPEPIPTHNYKSSFTRSDMTTATSFDSTLGEWKVEVPDSVEGATGARLFYTIESHAYAWEPTDTLIWNDDLEIPLPEPVSPVGTWQTGVLGNDYTPYSTSVEIPVESIKKGTNVLKVRATYTTTVNHHLEVYFKDLESAPAYTQPGSYVAPKQPALIVMGPSTQLISINGEGLLDQGSSHSVIEYAEAEVSATFSREIPEPVSGTVTFGVAVDNFRPLAMAGPSLGVSKIEMYLDGELISTVALDATTPAPAALNGAQVYPYTCCGFPIEIDTTQLTNGDHIINFIAYDAEGNPGRTFSPVNARADGGHAIDDGDTLIRVQN